MAKEKDDAPYTETNVAQTAASLYNLTRRISQLVVPDEPMGEWDGLGYERQAPWLYLATRGPKKLEELEGTKLQDASYSLFLLTCNATEEDNAPKVWEGFPETTRLMWLALTGHLFTLMDCDTMQSPGDSEDMWLNKYVQRCNQNGISFGLERNVQ